MIHNILIIYKLNINITKNSYYPNMLGLSEILAEYRKMYVYVAIPNFHSIYWEPTEWIRQLSNMNISNSHQQNETKSDSFSLQRCHMCIMAFQITSNSTVRSGTHQKKYQSTALLALCEGIHHWLLLSPHKGPVMWKICPYHIIMYLLIYRIIESQSIIKGLGNYKISCTYFHPKQLWDLPLI